jgi:GNAT superfamily N-acetyltransferase
MLRVDGSPRRVHKADREILALRDGRIVGLRPVDAVDQECLGDFFSGLSDRSRFLRFFNGAPNTDAAAACAASVNETDNVGLLALDGKRIVGHAAYVRMNALEAEVAVEVADDYQHLGLATLLLTRLAKTASQRHVAWFVADVLSENLDMLAVFHDGFDATQTFEAHDAKIRFPTSAWRIAARRFDANGGTYDHRAAALARRAGDQKRLERNKRRAEHALADGRARVCGTRS